MSINARVINATPEHVDAVLRDGWNYADWVVGAVHIRSVDPAWPTPGSRVHHRIGAWPLTLNDSTEVTAYEPGKRLELHAHARPFGDAAIRISWQATSSSSCRVRMEEQFTSGPALTLRNALGDLVLHARNDEALSRLEHLTNRYPA
jgi:hypothetical protein